jgi:NADPH2:quinone reductase
VTGAAPATIRVWQSGEPGLGGLVMSQQPCPSPSANEILVKVEAAALNFSDALMIEDRYQVRPPRPFVPGQEIAGAVVTAGSASAFAPGDRVTGKVTWGGFADYALMRADMAIRIPVGLSTASAAALPVVYTTAMVSLTESTTVKPGETVLVLAAAGGVGLATVQIARALGARVIAATGGADKGRLAVAHGAEFAVDYSEAGWSDAVKTATGGNGADIIVDPVGGNATREALRVMAWEGRLLIVGFSSGEIPAIPANRLLLRRASAIGVYWNHDRDAAMLARVSHRLTELLQAGAIAPHVSETFAFPQLPQALAALAERRTTGKIVLSCADEERP